MIFIDSNIPMYAAGADSPCKESCIQLIEKIDQSNLSAASSAEVLQEILHRYRRLGRISDCFKAYEAFRALPLRWLEVLPDDADGALELLRQYPHLSSRDAIHVAVMHRVGIRKIATYDQGFLGLPDVTVYLPHQV